MSKYEALWEYIKGNKKDEYRLTCEEIKNILGFDIDHSFLTYKKELLDYGYEVKKISLKEKSVLIVKNKKKFSSFFCLYITTKPQIFQDL